ncbi:mgtA regulatory leader peptide MgtL [Escherichia coli]
MRDSPTPLPRRRLKLFR